MPRRLIAAAGLVVTLSSSAAEPAAAPETPMHVDLQLTPARVAHPEDLAVTVAIRNDGDRDVVLPINLLGYPTLVFEATDARGRTVALGPPPLPPAELAKDTLAAGATRTLQFAGAAIFTGRLQPGTYTLRFRVTTQGIDGVWQGELASDGEAFTVAP